MWVVSKGDVVMEWDIIHACCLFLSSLQTLLHARGHHCQPGRLVCCTLGDRPVPLSMHVHQHQGRAGTQACAHCPCKHNSVRRKRASGLVPLPMQGEECQASTGTWSPSDCSAARAACCSAVIRRMSYALPSTIGDAQVPLLSCTCSRTHANITHMSEQVPCASQLFVSAEHTWAIQVPLHMQASHRTCLPFRYGPGPL